MKTHKIIINSSSIDLGRCLHNAEGNGGKFIDMTKYQKQSDIDRLFVPEKRPIIIDFLYPGQRLLFYKRLWQKTNNKFVIVIDQDMYFQDMTGGVLSKL